MGKLDQGRDSIMGEASALVSGLFTAVELENALIHFFRERTEKTEMEKSGVEWVGLWEWQQSIERVKGKEEKEKGRGQSGVSHDRLKIIFKLRKNKITKMCFNLKIIKNYHSISLICGRKNINMYKCK